MLVRRAELYEVPRKQGVGENHVGADEKPVVNWLAPLEVDGRTARTGPRRCAAGS